MSPSSKARARAKTAKKPQALRARARASATPELAAKLARALAELARDLANPADESTDFFHAFVAPLSPDIQLDAGTFQQALKIGSRYQVDLRSAEAILSNAGDPDNSGEETAQGFRLLEKVMRDTLSGLSVAFARGKGVVRVRMWLFGRFDDGSLVGLRSMSTET